MFDTIVRFIFIPLGWLCWSAGWLWQFCAYRFVDGFDASYDSEPSPGGNLSVSTDLGRSEDDKPGEAEPK